MDELAFRYVLLVHSPGKDFGVGAGKRIEDGAYMTSVVKSMHPPSAARGHLVQNFLIAWHCLATTGGVRCRKLGTFISSTLANLEGITCKGRFYSHAVNRSRYRAVTNILLPVLHVSLPDWERHY